MSFWEGWNGDGRAHMADCAVDRFECLYDLCLVWTPEVPRGVAVEGHPRQLQGIAFFEYCLQVPGNRIGSQVYTVDQLKVIQEVITLTVFGVFSVFYFGDRLHWNHAVAFACLVCGRVLHVPQVLGKENAAMVSGPAAHRCNWIGQR